MRTAWLAATLTLVITAPAHAQRPALDASTRPAVGATLPRESNERSKERQPVEPAKPSDMGPHDKPGNSHGARAQEREDAGRAGPMGSTAGKIEGSEPVDSGIGRPAPGTAGGALKGRGAGAVR